MKKEYIKNYLKSNLKNMFDSIGISIDNDDIYNNIFTDNIVNSILVLDIIEKEEFDKMSDIVGVISGKLLHHMTEDVTISEFNERIKGLYDIIAKLNIHSKNSYDIEVKHTKAGGTLDIKNDNKIIASIKGAYLREFISNIIKHSSPLSLETPDIVHSIQYTYIGDGNKIMSDTISLSVTDITAIIILYSDMLYKCMTEMHGDNPLNTKSIKLIENNNSLISQKAMIEGLDICEDIPKSSNNKKQYKEIFVGGYNTIDTKDNEPISNANFNIWKDDELFKNDIKEIYEGILSHLYELFDVQDIYGSVDYIKNNTTFIKDKISYLIKFYEYEHDTDIDEPYINHVIALIKILSDNHDMILHTLEAGYEYDEDNMGDIESLISVYTTNVSIIGIFFSGLEIYRDGIYSTNRDIDKDSLKLVVSPMIDIYKFYKLYNSITMDKENVDINKRTSFTVLYNCIKYIEFIKVPFYVDNGKYMERLVHYIYTSDIFFANAYDVYRNSINLNKIYEKSNDLRDVASAVESFITVSLIPKLYGVMTDNDILSDTNNIYNIQKMLDHFMEISPAILKVLKESSEFIVEDKGLIKTMYEEIRFGRKIVSYASSIDEDSPVNLSRLVATAFMLHLHKQLLMIHEVVLILYGDNDDNTSITVNKFGTNIDIIDTDHEVVIDITDYNNSHIDTEYLADYNNKYITTLIESINILYEGMYNIINGICDTNIQSESTTNVKNSTVDIIQNNIYLEVIDNIADALDMVKDIKKYIHFYDDIADILDIVENIKNMIIETYNHKSDKSKIDELVDMESFSDMTDVICSLPEACFIEDNNIYILLLENTLHIMHDISQYIIYDSIDGVFYTISSLVYYDKESGENIPYNTIISSYIYNNKNINVSQDIKDVISRYLENIMNKPFSDVRIEAYTDIIEMIVSSSVSES